MLASPFCLIISECIRITMLEKAEGLIYQWTPTTRHKLLITTLLIKLKIKPPATATLFLNQGKEQRIYLILWGTLLFIRIKSTTSFMKKDQPICMRWGLSQMISTSPPSKKSFQKLLGSLNIVSDLQSIDLSWNLTSRMIADSSLIILCPMLWLALLISKIWA